MKRKRAELTAEKLNIYITLLSWVIMGGLAAGIMWQTAIHKTIVIEESENRADNTAEMAEGRLLQLRPEQREDNRIFIPLEKDIAPDKVVLENHYMDRELWITLQDTDTAYYQENAVYGDLEGVIQGRYREQDKSVMLVFDMNSVYEYRSIMEDGKLIVTYENPGEVYRQVVVVEPVGNSEAERKITGSVAAFMQEISDQEDTKLYVVDYAGREPDREGGRMFVQQTQADLYVALSVSSAEDTGLYGIQSFFNEEYIIPGFGNMELADVLTRNVTIEVKNRAIGLVPVREDALLGQMSVPAARLSMGFITNETERTLLEQEAYRKKLAQGIAEAIKEVYTIRYEQ